MLTSIQAGVREAGPSRWLLIALGDQPSLRAGTVRALLDAGEANRAALPICIPVAGGRRGHPLLLHGDHAGELLALPPEGGMRALLLRHPERIREVRIDDEAILRDLDTPEDYSKELELAVREPGPGSREDE